MIWRKNIDSNNSKVKYNMLKIEEFKFYYFYIMWVNII